MHLPNNNAALCRFPRGPQLLAWIDTPTMERAPLLPAARPDLTTSGDGLRLGGAFDGPPGWTWHATIAPHATRPGRWCCQLTVAAAEATPVALTVALTGLGPAPRWLYNVRFDRRTFLGSLDFRTAGADLASPSNQHLHTYGLLVLPELLQLWRATGDDYYHSAARDLLGFARQTLARVDGECNARRGMLTEQWFHVDWTHPKGAILQLAHAWCNGLAIYAMQEAARWGQIWIGERVWSLEPTGLVDPADPPEQLRLINPFEVLLRLRVRLRPPWQTIRLSQGAATTGSDELGPWVDLSLAPGATLVLHAGR